MMVLESEEIFAVKPYQQHCRAQVLAMSGSHLALDKTVCYPSGGGQPGDRAELVNELLGSLEISQTFRDRDNSRMIWHKVNDDADLSTWINEPVHVHLDWDRRYRHMQMHTALHLLCAIVSAPVTGCSIGAERSRIDFDLADPIDKASISNHLAQLISDDLLVQTEPEATSRATDAFRSVPPPVSDGSAHRIVSIGSIDRQPCGGTHVARTGEIAPLICRKVEKKGRKNRRVTIQFHED